jgi:hypothetical protein
MGIKLKVSGINLVLSGLDKYSRDIQNLVQNELVDWAERTESAAKRDVPVDTGALKNSIRWVVGSDKLSVSVKAGGINGVDYAAFVNFGTGTFVSDTFLQEYGLVKYASDFKGKGIREVNLPMRDFLYRNARTEFEKTFQNIKKILENNRNL